MSSFKSPQTPSRRRQRIKKSTPLRNDITSEIESSGPEWEDEGSIVVASGPGIRFLPSPPTSPNRKGKRVERVVKERDREPERRKESPRVQPRRNVASDAGMDFLGWTAGLLFDVIRILGGVLRKPLALLLVLYILTLLISRFLSTLLIPLQPLCNMPIISSSLPFCTNPPDRPSLPDYPSLVDLQTHLEPILEITSTGTSLALDVKNSEMAIRDLTTLVKLSDLVCKDELEEKLTEFVGEARDAGRSLQRLGSRVGGAVDSILAFDEYILRTLSALPPGSVDQAPLPSAILSYIIPFYPQHPSVARKTLISTFAAVSQDMQSQIHRLILESETTMILLDRLEEGLNLIHEMVERENLDVKAKADEVLADLWTLLGGNKRKLSNFSSHRNLLANIGRYRSQALIRVSSTAVQLRQLSADLEDLRDRVATPGLVGVKEQGGAIPVEVHIESIKMGVERLAEFRRRSVEKENEFLRKTLNGQTVGPVVQAIPAS